MTKDISFKTVVTFGVALIGALVLLGYVAFQARFLIVGPKIFLSDAPPLLHNERQVTLEGTTHNISRLWLNDRPIYTDPEGKFTETLILENGYTVATLRAEDRYGRETTVARPFVFLPASFVR